MVFDRSGLQRLVHQEGRASVDDVLLKRNPCTFECRRWGLASRFYANDEPGIAGPERIFRGLARFDAAISI